MKNPLVHLVIWIAYFILEFAASHAHYAPFEYGHLVFDILVQLPFIMIATYWVYYRIIPNYIQKRKKPVFIGELLGAIAIIYAGRYGVAMYAYNAGESIITMLPWSKVLKNFIKDLSFAALVSCILFIRDWHRQEGIIRLLRRTTAEQRLALLLQQLAPHFLFNTLNNIYSLLQKHPKEAAEQLLQLSDVLEYVVHTEIHHLTSFEDEWRIAHKYINLHKMKYGEKLKVTEPLFTRQIQLAPMILLSLLENAFKHGGEHDGTFHLHIHLNETPGKYMLTVQNSVSTTDQFIKSSSKGKHIIRELLALHYHNDFQFHTNLEGNFYRVQISWPYET